MNSCSLFFTASNITLRLHFFALIVVYSLFISLQVFAQSIPDGFPIFVDTGNPKEDTQRYDEAKKAWIEKNKEMYDKMRATQDATKQPIQNMPEVVDKLLDTPIIPPVMIPPYNPAQVNTNFRAVEVPTINTTEQQVELSQPQLVAMPPHYPIVPKTGNPTIDEANHIEAKNKWIAQYPDEYRSMGGVDPEVEVEPIAETTMTISNLPEFVPIKEYRLVKVEAVALDSTRTDTKEIELESEKLREDFEEYITRFHIGENNQIRLLNPGKLDLRAIEIRNGNAVEWFFENQECNTCSKTLYLYLEQETSNTLVYLMQSEDENAPFSYRLIFKIL